MKAVQLFCFSFLAIAIFSSCNKDEKCGEYVSLYAPILADEGEDFTLEVIKLEKTGIESFLWSYPDMTGAKLVAEGMVGTSEPRLTIKFFNIKDVGTYYVKMYPKNSKCQPIIRETVVGLNPKKCDCPEPPSENVLYYTPNYEGEFTEEPLTIAADNTSEYGTITATGTKNTLSLFFGIKLPEFSSTFYSLHGDYLNWNPNYSGYAYSGIHTHLKGYNRSLFYFDFPKSKEIYVEHTGSQLILQFCNLIVRDSLNQEFQISSKLRVDI